MKHLALTVLLLATPLVADAQTNTPPRMNHEQAEGKVLKVYAAKDGEAESRAYAVLWKDQEVIVGDMFAETNFKEGDTIKFMVVRLPRRAGKELLQFQVMVERTKIFKPAPRAVQNPANHMVFFECRGDELFCIEKDSLDAQVNPIFTNHPVTITSTPIGNANYTVNPSYLLTGLMKLDARPNVHGETAAAIADPASQFQKALQTLNRQHDTVVFMVRDDSAGVAAKAQQIAEAAGFTPTVQPLAKDKALMFGNGGIQVQPAGPPAPESK